MNYFWSRRRLSSPPVHAIPLFSRSTRWFFHCSELTSRLQGILQLHFQFKKVRTPTPGLSPPQSQRFGVHVAAVN